MRFLSCYISVRYNLDFREGNEDLPSLEVISRIVMSEADMLYTKILLQVQNLY
jgi:hypothetical protein